MISVVSAYYNDLYCIEDCIKSVRASASNVAFPVEHIICDDASSIVLPREILPKDVVLLRHGTNLGPAAARNTAIRAAKHPWILNLDSDDMIDPEYISACAPYLNTYDIVYTDTHWFGSIERDFMQWDLSHPSRLINHPLSSCLLFKKELWEEIGGYNESSDLIGHEDWAFTLALAKSGRPWKHIHEHLYLYRRKQCGSLYDKVLPLKQERMQLLRELYG